MPTERPTTPTTARRPLYLNSSEPVRVRVQPPALCIGSEHRAERLYPLRRIDRILVSGPVEWETRALLACAARDIPIVFSDDKGHTLCRMVGPGVARGSLPELLERLFHRPDWDARYRQWCWAKNQQTRRYVARRLNIRFTEVRDFARLPQRCVQRLNRVLDERTLGRILQWMHADLHAVVTTCLQNEGLWREHALGLVEPINLARDITHILQPVLLEIRDREVRRSLDTETPGRREAAQWFANRTSYVQYQIARVVNHLEIWIMEGA